MPFERIQESNVKKDHRDCSWHYYVPNVEIKDFNVLIDGNSFFDFLAKIEEEVMTRNDDYTIGNLLVFAYFRDDCRLIVTDLSKQTKLKDPQKISFISKHENQAHRATMFFIIEKSKEATFDFLQNSVNIL